MAFILVEWVPMDWNLVLGMGRLRLENSRKRWKEMEVQVSEFNFHDFQKENIHPMVSNVKHLHLVSIVFYL